jgi:hypothetical protein
MNNYRMVAMVAFVALATACQSLYVGAVTLTKVVDAASKDYARVYNDGLVTAEVASAVAEAHLTYRKAVGVAQMALIAYRDSGDQASYTTALEAARKAAEQFVDLIVPYLSKDKTISLRTQLAKAGAP